MTLKIRALLFIMLATGVFCAAPLTHAASLEAMQATYISEMGKIRNSASENKNKLKSEYIASLEALVKKTQDAGQLEPLLALNRELARFKDKEEIPRADLAKDFPELLALQESYRTAAGRIPVDRAKRISTLVTQYDRSLARLQENYTRANKLPEALAIKQERDTVQNSADVIAAAKLLTDLEASQSAQAIERVTTVQPVQAAAVSKLSDRPLSASEKSKIQSHIRRRYEAFYKETMDQDFEKAREYVDPRYIEKNGTQAADGIIRMVSAFLRPTEKQHVKFAVDKVELDEENKDAATVTPKVWANNQWHKAPPSKWVKVEDEWYLKMGNQSQQASGFSKRGVQDQQQTVIPERTKPVRRLPKKRWRR